MRAAKMLKWPFYEMDDEIERRERRTIPAIFEQFGEDHFRQVETAVLETAASRPPQVVSTGGGVPTRSENREIMAVTGVVVRLSASPETINSRLTASQGDRGRSLRPLLGGDAPVERVRSLLAEREGAYSICDAEVDTEGKSHEQVATEIVEAWRRLAAEKGFSDE